MSRSIKICNVTTRTLDRPKLKFSRSSDDIYGGHLWIVRRTTVHGPGLSILVHRQRPRPTICRQDHDLWIRSVDFGPQTHSLNQTMEEQERPQLGPSSVDLGPKTHSFNQTIKKQDAPILGPWSIDHIHQSYPTDQFYESNNKGTGRTIVRTTLSGQISWILVHRLML